LYDASFSFDTDTRVRLVDKGLKQLSETKTKLVSMLIDRPVIDSIPSNSGFVVAGCNHIVDKEKKPVRQECRVSQYDSDGKIVGVTSINITEKVFLNTHVVCSHDRACVAIQTKGRSPLDLKEAGIFEIVLKTK
jgi:hypothetical protein